MSKLDVDALTSKLTPFVESASHASRTSLLVVIVNYRTARLVIESLRALEGEVRSRPAVCPEIRVAVIDNDSQDGSVEQLQRAITDNGWGKWAMLIASPHNGGYAFGNNLAVRAALKAKSPPAFFHLLNPDTQVRPGALSALVSFLQGHPQVGIAGSCLLNEDGSEWLTAFRFPSVMSELEEGVRIGALSKVLGKFIVARKMDGRVPERVDWLPGASMMVRKEVFDRIGLMDERYFLYYEETDFCLQAARAGFEAWYVPESKVMHVAGQSTGVTDRKGPPKRRPAYLFESRRRYYMKNYGVVYAALADVAFNAGLASWRVRRILQGKPDNDPPNLLSDSLKHSVFVTREHEDKRNL